MRHDHERKRRVRRRATPLSSASAVLPVEEARICRQRCRCSQGNFAMSSNPTGAIVDAAEVVLVSLLERIRRLELFSRMKYVHVVQFLWRRVERKSPGEV